MSFRLFPIATAAATLALAAEAHAEPVSATGKGITGGALLGAEAVMLVEAAFDVQPAWAYVVGGLAGGVGGGVAGYFVEQGDAKISLYMLAGGMTLVIPTTVAILSTTHYKPAVEYTEDRGPTDEPTADPAQPDAAPGEAAEPDAPAEPAPKEGRAPKKLRRGSAPERSTLRHPSLLAYDEGALLLSVPAVEFRDVFTRREIADLGVRQSTEVRVPVLAMTF